MSATADQDLAELRRANAELRDALAQRDSQYGERIEHQSATIDVLKVMSASPGDPQPVFDLIARQAAKLCNVPAAAVATFDGTTLHLATQSGFDPAYADAYVARFPRPVGTDSSMGRAILNRRIDVVDDIAADPHHSFADVLGHWSAIAFPMLRDGMPLGAIAIGRPAIMAQQMTLTLTGTYESRVIQLLRAARHQARLAQADSSPGCTTR